MVLPQVLDAQMPNDPACRGRWLLTAGLYLGLPMDGRGDHLGCYEVLNCVARLVLETLEATDGSKQQLSSALEGARSRSIPSQQAWVLRQGVENLLGDQVPAQAHGLAEAGAQDAPVDSHSRIRTYLHLAVQVGEAALACGDIEGCLAVYSHIDELLVARTKGAYEPRRLLRQAQQRCRATTSAQDKVHIFRGAFEEILHGRREALVRVQSYLSMAIELGAPAFDAGDEKGCYELYACVARMILNTTTDSERHCGQLRIALQEAGTERNPGAKAWRLRNVFDDILACDAVDEEAE